MSAVRGNVCDVQSEVPGDDHPHSLSVLISPWAWRFASLSEFSVWEVWSLFFPLSSCMSWKQTAWMFYLMMPQCRIDFCGIHQTHWYLNFPFLPWCTCGDGQTTWFGGLRVHRAKQTVLFRSVFLLSWRRSLIQSCASFTFQFGNC